jgi:hypothetical protein
MTVMVCTLAVAAGASASTMQFSVNGIPVDGSVQEVPQGITTIGIYMTPDVPVETFFVEFFATGPWVAPEPLPELDDLIASGDVRMLAVWDNEFAAAQWDVFYSTWVIGGFLPGELESEPQVVAEFDVDLSSYVVSTVLNLEFDFAEVGLYEADVMLPLVLHVTPEPATVGLLVFGGLAALWRRR